MKQRILQLKENAEKQKKVFKQAIKKIKRKTPKNFDYIMMNINERVFNNIDCLSCANCCKTTSPIVTEKDITRISKFLKLKEITFIERYLEKDIDGYWMFSKIPCVFLDSDNYCLIYNVRPKACREYPHLNRRKNIQLLDLHLKNTKICPAVFDAFLLLNESFIQKDT